MTDSESVTLPFVLGQVLRMGLFRISCCLTFVTSLPIQDAQMGFPNGLGDIPPLLLLSLYLITERSLEGHQNKVKSLCLMLEFMNWRHFLTQKQIRTGSLLFSQPALAATSRLCDSAEGSQFYWNSPLEFPPWPLLLDLFLSKLFIFSLSSTHLLKYTRKSNTLPVMLQLSSDYLSTEE